MATRRKDKGKPRRGHQDDDSLPPPVHSLAWKRWLRRSSSRRLAKVR